MNRPRPITIVGGGLAGLTLGIGLRRQSIPVVLWEQGHYPRHRVCGEFISGHGQETLKRLGLLELLLEAGARPAYTAAFFAKQRSFPAHPLPQPALCISRFNLDEALAEQFKQSGGELHCGTRAPSTPAEGTVRSTGRRAEPEADAEGWRWFGLKAHAHRIALHADLEMHTRADGYVGLCRLEDGKTNVCGLFRRKKGEAVSAFGITQRLRGESGSILHQRLEAAEFEEASSCAVGGLSLHPRRAIDSGECCIGDSVTMIAPVTGNGMSMAFESAELAVAPLAAYARGEIEWQTARQTVARECDRTFAKRLWWADRLQRMLFWQSTQAWVLGLALRWETSWRFLFWATR